MIRLKYPLRQKMMSSSITIRQAGQKDIAVIHQIQCKAFEPRWHEPVSIFDGMLQAYPEGCFLIEKDSKPAGYLFCHPAEEGRKDYEQAGWELTGQETCLYIHDLCVDPDFQGQGIARQAFEFVEGFSLSKGFRKLIGVAVGDVGPFWEKQGFTMQSSYMYNGEEAIFMSRELND